MVGAPEVERADGLQALELEVGVERLDEAQGRADRHAGEPRGRLPDILGGDHATFSSSSASPLPFAGPSWPLRKTAGGRRHPRHPPRLPPRPPSPPRPPRAPHHPRPRFLAFTPWR